MNTLDTVREYWDRRPCNVRHSPTDINVDPLGYSVEVSIRKYFVEPHIQRLAEFPRWIGKRVLDLGCGIGTDSISFAMMGAQVTAVDISRASLDIAYKRAVAHGLDKRIDFRCGNIEDYVITKPHSYDLVWSFGAIHHTPNPWAVIEKVPMYLKYDQGEFRCMLYYRRSWKALKLWAAAGFPLGMGLDAAVARGSEAQRGCPVTHTYTKAYARDLLESHGLDIVKMSVEHIFPYRVEDYIRYRYVKALPWRVMPPRLFRWLEHQIGWHLCIVARPY